MTAVNERIRGLEVPSVFVFQQVAVMLPPVFGFLLAQPVTEKLRWRTVSKVEWSRWRL